MVQVRTSQTFLRDITVIGPAALLLFGGRLQVVHGAGHVLIDDWLRVRAPAPTAVLVSELRRGLDFLLQQKIRQPKADVTADGQRLIDSIIALLQHEEMQTQHG